MSDTPRPAASAVDKAFGLVEHLAAADRPLRLSELAAALGLHRATAYRVLVDLVRRGWVLRCGDHYLLGATALRVSRLAVHNSLAALCHPALEALSERTAMMANLQVLEPDGSRVIDVVRPERLEMISDLAGELLPIHRFAGPLALIACLGEQAQRPYLQAAEAAGRPLTGHTGLVAELARTRRRGYALERGRNQRLIASMSAAVVSAKGDPVCALTVVGPDPEFGPSRQGRLTACLRDATREVDAVLAGLAAAS